MVMRNKNGIVFVNILIIVVTMILIAVPEGMLVIQKPNLIISG